MERELPPGYAVAVKAAKLPPDYAVAVKSIPQLPNEPIAQPNAVAKKSPMAAKNQVGPNGLVTQKKR